MSNFHCSICGKDSGIKISADNLWKLKDDLGWELNFSHPIRKFCPDCKGHAYDYIEEDDE